jgi:lysozyme
MKCSDAGIRFIKGFEAFRPVQYRDAVGIPTIGYGHVIRPNDVEHFRGRTLTEAEATGILCDDLEIAEAHINDLVTVDLAQHEFDALCSFVFNVGARAFETSTLLKKINAGDLSASQEFLRWDHAGGKVLAGLTKRREAEAEMFA